ncbi:MAG: ABC transporter ATP-binding protein [bacterium]
MSLYKRLIKYIIPYRWRLLLALICMVLVAVTTLALPWFIKVVLANAISKHNILQLNLTILSALVTIFIWVLSQYGQNFLMSYVGQKVIYSFRNEIFKHLTFLSLKFYKDRQTGQIMSRIINDVSLLENFIISGVVDIIKEPLVLVGAICIAFYLNWQLAILSLFVAPFIALSIFILGLKMKKITLKIQSEIANVTATLQEVISGIYVVKVFAMEPYEREKFNEINKRYFKAFLKGIRIIAASTPLVHLFSTGGTIVVVWFGAYQVLKGTLSVEDLIAFGLYLAAMSPPIRRLTHINLVIQRAIAASQRIFEVIDTEIKVAEHAQANELPTITGKVEFENVSFSYEDELVLDGIDLQVNPGEVLAIVGPSGNGKTTIVNLIPRLYDPNSGKVMIDGYDIKFVKTQSLRRQIGVVPQEIILFNGTVMENIAYGKIEATFDEIVEAAKAANAHEFITHLPHGYDTQIGEHGVKLSGGQRQRIAIARAIVRKPKILILDEATSSLDSESETLIQASLAEIMKHQTTIVIAHRLSTVINADKIAVLDKGKITELGTHHELLKLGGLYSKLYKHRGQTLNIESSSFYIQHSLSDPNGSKIRPDTNSPIS